MNFNFIFRLYYGVRLCFYVLSCLRLLRVYWGPMAVCPAHRTF